MMPVAIKLLSIDVVLIQGQGRRSLTVAEWIENSINSRTDLQGRMVNNLQQAQGDIV